MAVTALVNINKTTDSFLLDSYSGLGGYALGTYLMPHKREDEADYAARRALAVYPNFARKIVDVYMGFLWKQTPNRDNVSDLYSRFIANSDGLGGKLDTVLSSYQRLAMILGTVYVIVDKPPVQGPTRATEATPYLNLRLKSQLIKEDKDNRGVWTRVTFVEQGANNIRLYRTFTRTGWLLSTDSEGRQLASLSDGDGNPLPASGSYNLGRVPVVRLHIAKPLNPTDSCSQSFFYDLAQLNWQIYNLESELREQERQQAFSILTFPASSPEERTRLSTMTVGTSNGMIYDPTGGGRPDFIAPPADPMQHYMARIAATVQDIYRVANLEFVGSVQPSGEALSFHFMEANSALAGMAEMAEMAETEIAQLVHLWQGQLFDGHISYPADFNMSDVAKSIGIAMDSVNLGMGAEFDKAIKKLLAKQILRNDVASKTMQAIDAEIDAQGDVYGDRILKQAMAPV
jgi:hypothetical protein